MKPPAAFRATYSDWKLIRTRKVVQIVLEVPVEEADIAYQVLDGMPNSGESIWCAVARLKVVAGDSKPSATLPAPRDEDKPVGRAKREWSRLSAAEQAGLRCNDPAFQVFLREEHPGSWREIAGIAENAAIAVRSICRVDSRSQINSANPESLRLWQELERNYRLWQTAPEFA